MNPTGCLDHVGVSYPGFDLCDTLLRQGEIGGQPPEWKWDISPSSYFSLFSNSTWSSLFFIYHWHHQHYHSGEIFLIVRHGTDRAFWWKLWCAYITFVTYSSPQCFHLIPYMLSMLPSTSLLQNTLASGRNECKAGMCGAAFFSAGRGKGKNPRGGAGWGGAKVKIHGAGRGGAGRGEKARKSTYSQNFTKLRKWKI